MFRKGKSKSNLNLDTTTKGLSALRTSTSAENLSSNAVTFVEDQKNLMNRVIKHQVAYLGTVLDSGRLHQSSKDPEGHIVERIEEAQLNGEVRILLNDEDAVSMAISKHGVKILDPKTEIVLQRYPLHRICQLIAYDDGLNKANLIVKVGSAGKTTNSLYVFQCKNEEQTQKICNNVLSFFDLIGSKKT